MWRSCASSRRRSRPSRRWRSRRSTSRRCGPSRRRTGGAVRRGRAPARGRTRSRSLPADRSPLLRSSADGYQVFHLKVRSVWAATAPVLTLQTIVKGGSLSAYTNPGRCGPKQTFRYSSASRTKVRQLDCAVLGHHRLASMAVATVVGAAARRVALLATHPRAGPQRVDPALCEAVSWQGGISPICCGGVRKEVGIRAQWR